MATLKWRVLWEDVTLGDTLRLLRHFESFGGVSEFRPSRRYLRGQVGRGRVHFVRREDAVRCLSTPFPPIALEDGNGNDGGEEHLRRKQLGEGFVRHTKGEILQDLTRVFARPLGNAPQTSGPKTASTQTETSLQRRRVVLEDLEQTPEVSTIQARLLRSGAGAIGPETGVKEHAGLLRWVNEVLRMPKPRKGDVEGDEGKGVRSIGLEDALRESKVKEGDIAGYLSATPGDDGHRVFAGFDGHLARKTYPQHLDLVTRAVEGLGLNGKVGGLASVNRTSTATTSPAASRTE
ncbi:hypothetical protein PYCC9005_005032 [Savitreella phatthalungensis]